MVELREPPLEAASRRPGALPYLLAVQLALLVLVVVLLVMGRSGGAGSAGGDPEALRDLAGRLKAAGALDESAHLLERYLEDASLDPQVRANVAYSLGQTFLERGRPESALRWFYEAEDLDEGSLREELARKIVHCLERMGRSHAAQTALASRVRLDASREEEVEEVRRAASDPVVARVGEREILRSDVQRALDDLPAQARSGEDIAAMRAQLLRQFVADELLYNKARKLEYDRDPDVVRAAERLAQQLAISKFVQEEVLAGLSVDPADLETFFRAHRDRYAAAGGDQEVTLDQVREVVRRDYLQMKTQGAYQELIERELEAAGAELFPERMGDG